MADLLSAQWSAEAIPPVLTPVEWETLLGQARRTGLLARLALHAADQGWLPAVPLPARHYLESAGYSVERQRHSVLNELSQIRRALKDSATPLVLLKGAAYLLAGLPPARARLFSDIDLLVVRDQIAETEGNLFAAGWISEERDAYNQRYYRQWMHEIPPLRHVQRGAVIDLHHTIAPLTARFKVDATKLLERIEPVGSSGFFVLGPHDMVLHSALHLYLEGEFDHGLRDLLDLNDLLRHFGRDEAFWPALFARAQELGLGEPLFHVLSQARRLFGLRIPAACDDALAAIRPSALARRWTTFLLDRGLRPHHPSCDTRASDAARWLLYVRSHRLRMPLHLIVPHLLRKAFMTRFG